jgi:hypothetical protein
MLSRKHYTEVAEILNRFIDEDIPHQGFTDTEWLLTSFSAMFLKDNPRFDPERFRQAVYK